jgi:hypothetical protein
VVEELAILMHDADARAQVGDLVARDGVRIRAKDADLARCRQQFGVAELEESRLSSARRAGQEVE